MKKAALSAAVVIAFILYSIHQRHEGASAIVLPNKLTSSSANNTSTSTGSSPSTTGTNTTGTQSSSYKDGTYTGSVEDAFYGNIQVQVVIQGGKIMHVNFLQHPNDNPTSQYINAQADPYLAQEAIQAQSAQVDTITGATDSSLAFIQSLTTALSNAR